MTEGGKRRANKSLKQWVAFVKKVAKEEGLEYRKAMMRAKARADKGEKWQKGGEGNDAPMRRGGGETDGKTPVKTPADPNAASSSATPVKSDDETPANTNAASSATPVKSDDETNVDPNATSNGGRRQSRRQSRQQSRRQRRGGRRQSRQQSRRQSRRDRR
jgi:hypothetical protein